jgi:chromosome segregation ATPase
MPEFDKILEAERNIRGIAAEFERMQKAVDLLHNSQRQVELVINSAQQVVGKADWFAVRYEELLRSYSPQEIMGRLQLLDEKTSKLSIDLHHSRDSLGNQIANSSQRVEDLQGAIKALREQSDGLAVSLDQMIITSKDSLLKIYQKIDTLYVDLQRATGGLNSQIASESQRIGDLQAMIKSLEEKSVKLAANVNQANASTNKSLSVIVEDLKSSRAEAKRHRIFLIGLMILSAVLILSLIFRG